MNSNIIFTFFMFYFLDNNSPLHVETLSTPSGLPSLSPFQSKTMTMTAQTNIKNVEEFIKQDKNLNIENEILIK